MTDCATIQQPAALGARARLVHSDHEVACHSGDSPNVS